MKRAIISYQIITIYYILFTIIIYLYLSTAVGHLHSVLNHSNGALLMNLVGAWQDLTTAERILCRVQKVDLITIFILLLEKFLQFDWLRAVVFQLNLKYLHVKITTFCG